MSPRIEIRRHSRETPWTYRQLDRRQHEIASELDADEGALGALLLSEVSPVITLGRRTGPGEILMEQEQLTRLGIDLYSIGRGGLATWHGPGQWVLFAVDRLERLTGDRRGVRKAVQGLLEVALEIARIHEPRSEIREGLETGVWSPRGKLASVGVHIERGVLLHGLSLNGFKSETSFRGLRPCGLDAPVDYLMPAADEGAFSAIGDCLGQAAMKRFWLS